ncbi:MAG: PDZ domain-containing protein [Betaproteobacteria bacterium]|nr:PDZ domain-containing protein [Betaproteobacteria bacterium]
MTRTDKHLEIIGRALQVTLLVALGLQLAWWGWRLLFPPWAAREIAVVETSAPSAQAPAKDPAPVRSSIRLKGVFAVDGKTLSAAVVNLGGRDQVVLKGTDIAQGTTLAEVAPDHIVVSRAGVRERIDLDRPGTRADGKAAQSTLTGGPAPTSFRLNVDNTANNTYGLSRQELNTVLQDPRQLNFLGRIGPSPSGGVRVDDAAHGTLAAKLGLMAGDIITAINGQPVLSQGDLVRIYSQFDSLGTVRVEIKRGGAPIALTYHVRN